MTLSHHRQAVAALDSTALDSAAAGAALATGDQRLFQFCCHDALHLTALDSIDVAAAAAAFVATDDQRLFLE